MLGNILQRLKFFWKAGEQPRGRIPWFDFFIGNPCRGVLFDLRGGTYRTDGCEFVVPRGMTNLGWRGACFGKDEYESDERTLVKRFISPDASVVEVGACLGVVSCVTNKLLRNRNRHVVVEANPNLIPWIAKNREKNSAGFLVEHCAIGTPPETIFYIHPSAIVDGSCQTGSGMPVRLPSRSLRELHDRYGPFDALIADVEGAELIVLEDSKPLLSSYNLAIFEFHPWIIGEEKIQRCRQILSEAGLKLVGNVGFSEAWKRD